MQVCASVGNGAHSKSDCSVLDGVKAHVVLTGGAQAESFLEPVRDVRAVASIGQPTGNVKWLNMTGYPHVLVSFIYDRKGDFFTGRLAYQPLTWMGDSGAYTVWTKGDHVDLAEYIRWCQHYAALNPDFVSVSLDVLPGRPRQPPTPRERKRGMAQSLENGDALREAGIRIIEVFHVYEPLSYLDTLLERRQPGERTGLGAMAIGVPPNELRVFCDSVFARLRDNYGWEALPPIHGFGVAPVSRIGGRYPWFSTDSSSWMASAQFGHSVGRSGVRMGKDRRTSNRSVREMYLTRVLERWNRHERALTELWEKRGIRFAP